jgi:hypothetical protein
MLREDAQVKETKRERPALREQEQGARDLPS